MIIYSSMFDQLIDVPVYLDYKMYKKKNLSNENCLDVRSRQHGISHI